MDILLRPSSAIIYPRILAHSRRACYSEIVALRFPSAAHALSRHIRLLFCGDPIRVGRPSRAEAFQRISRYRIRRTFRSRRTGIGKPSGCERGSVTPISTAIPSTSASYAKWQPFSGLLDHGLSAFGSPFAGRHPASDPHRHALHRASGDAGRHRRCVQLAGALRS